VIVSLTITTTHRGVKLKAVRSRESKTRYVGGVIAPESPVYMAGLIDDDVDADLVTVL
jgi:hypothetical protein